MSLDLYIFFLEYRWKSLSFLLTELLAVPKSFNVLPRYEKGRWFCRQGIHSIEYKKLQLIIIFYSVRINWETFPIHRTIRALCGEWREREKEIPSPKNRNDNHLFFHVYCQRFSLSFYVILWVFLLLVANISSCS